MYYLNLNFLKFWGGFPKTKKIPFDPIKLFSIAFPGYVKEKLQIDDK